jgi:hypothetical protein
MENAWIGNNDSGGDNCRTHAEPTLVKACKPKEGRAARRNQSVACEIDLEQRADNNESVSAPNGNDD